MNGSMTMRRIFMRSSGLLITLLLLIVAWSLFGCAKPEPPQAPAPPDESAPIGKVAESGEAAPETGAGEPKKEYRIAVVPKGTTHNFWLTVKAGAEEAAAEHGAKVLWNGPAKESEIDKQINILEDYVTQGVDAIVMAACDEEALIPTVKKALEQGIPVITIDSGIKSEDALCFVATDNLAGARQAADELAELIGGKGKVIVMPFLMGAATSQMREKGFKQQIEERYPDIKIVQTVYSKSEVGEAVRQMEDMLTRYPDLDGVFAANEPGALGVANVLKDRKLDGKVKVVAFDAAPDEIKHLKEGTIQALIVQNPFKMGYEGVTLAIQAIQGEMPKDKVVDTGVAVVTAENVDTPDIHKLLYPLEDQP
jgi:ribose transport system substrate-binding protein